MRALFVCLFCIVTTLSYAQIKVDENNNVGVGDETPVEKLDVDGTLLVSEKIGVGTESPSEMLTIRTTTGAGIQLESLSNPSFYKFTIKQYLNNEERFTFFDANSKVFGHKEIDGETRNYLASYTNLSFHTATSEPTSANERMTILGNGNVGINNIRPETQVEISAPIGKNELRFSQEDNHSYYSQIKVAGDKNEGFVINLDTPNNSLDDIFLIKRGGEGKLYEIDNIGQHKFFRVGVEQARINQDGFLGLGTSNPQERLDVNGKIREVSLGTNLIYANEGVLSPVVLGPNLTLLNGELNSFTSLVQEVSGAIRLQDNFNNTSIEGNARGMNAVEISPFRASDQNNVASGPNSVAIGNDIKASGDDAISIGSNSHATEANAIAIGGARVLGEGAIGVGENVEISAEGAIGIKASPEGELGVAIGARSSSLSYGEFGIGLYNEIYIPGSSIGFNNGDKIFDVGNGETLGDPSSAFSVYKSGASLFHPVENNTDIPSPRPGMIIFNSDISSFEGYDGTAWGPFGSGHPEVNEGTSLPAFSAELYPLGSPFIVENIGLYISDGEAWVLETVFKNKIEIPNTAFADKTNPKMDEVRTWVDANLTVEQKMNSELVMLEGVADATFAYTTGASVWENPQISLPFDFSGFTINGTFYSYPFEVWNISGQYVLDEAGLAIQLANSLQAEGFNNVSLDFSGFAEDPEIASLLFSLTQGEEKLVISLNGLDGYEDSLIPSAYVPTINNFGTTIEKPDYVWNITNDQLTEIHRRRNDGPVWYVNPHVSSTQAAFAQKGNPNRPLPSWDIMVQSANLQSGDIVHVMAGDQSFCEKSTVGDVTYHFEAGSNIKMLSSNFWTLVDIPDGNEELLVTGNVITDGSFKTNGTNGYVEGDEMGSVHLIGDGKYVVKVKKFNAINGAINLRPSGNKTSSCTVDVDYYYGHNLLANGSTKSNSNWIVHCKKWEYTGETGVTSQFYFNSDPSVNVNQHLIIDNWQWDGFTQGGGGFRSFLLNCASTGTILADNCQITIEIKKLTVDCDISAGADRINLMSLNKLNMINSSINLIIHDANIDCKIMRGGSGFSMTNSELNFDISGVTNTTFVPFKDLNGTLDENSKVTITGSMEHTYDGPFFTSTVSNPTTTESIYFEDFTLRTAGNLGTVNSNIHMYNSKFIVNDEEYMLESNGSVNLINYGTISNTANLGAGITQVGSTIFSSSAFK
ncbi:MAG: hypothetical protein P1U56_16575 [Saprospiraceae bacterium]|nr:hypothetical protein [Saprospiraceae bacterium]